MKKKLIMVSTIILTMCWNFNVLQKQQDNQQILISSLESLELRSSAQTIEAQGCNECILTDGWTCVNVLCIFHQNIYGYDCSNWYDCPVE